MSPRREAPVRPPPRRPVIAASDAQADMAPTGGYLMLDPATGVRVGGFYKFTQKFLECVGYDIATFNEGWKSNFPV